MSIFESPPTTPLVVRAELPSLDEAQLAAVAFLARYSGRTLESYRADLRQYFRWGEGDITTRLGCPLRDHQADRPLRSSTT